MNKNELTTCIITEDNAADYREARKALATVHKTAKTIVNDSIAADETPSKTVDTLVKTLGFETALETVAELVNMVGDWDERIYDTTRRWAASVPGALDKPALDKVQLYQTLHSVHVNQLAQAMRKAQEAAQKAQEAQEEAQKAQEAQEAAQKAQEAQEEAQPEEKPARAQKPARKADIFAKQAILYKGGKIWAPALQMWVPLLLKKGNTKLGQSIYTWSTLPTNGLYQVQFRADGVHVNDVIEGAGPVVVVPGTCPCHCRGCYATAGRYRAQNVLASLAINTILIRKDPDFVRRALLAQIEADQVEAVRVHAAGDFEGGQDVVLFRVLALAFRAVKFWTYTKRPEAVHAFDDVENFNVVPSILPAGLGFNFGTCGHILEAVDHFQKAGLPFHVCRCGIDPGQHCEGCKECSKKQHVLFIEHSTAYKAEKDPLFPALAALIAGQTVDQ